MGFTSLCKSDPILVFIRSTYGAIPLRVPDSRFAPLTVFTSKDGRARYLGELSSIVAATRLKKIQMETRDLPDLSQRTSTSMSLSAAISLLGPFLTNLLQLTQLDLSAAVSASDHKGVGVMVSLHGSKQTYVQPLICASMFSAGPLDFPSLSLIDDGQGKEHPLFLIDSILSAREITLTWDGDSAHEVSAKLESAIAGQVSPSAVLRSKSRLVITGSHRAPFAFTCLELVSNRRKQLSGLKLASQEPRFGLADVQKAQAAHHIALGDENELIDFDE